MDIKWLMVMAVTGLLVIQLQYLALVRILGALTEVRRQSVTYPMPDTERTPTSVPSSRAHL
jgi:hypothetical protein